MSLNFQPHSRREVLFLIWWTDKNFRFREVNCFAQGHTLAVWWGHIRLTPKSIFFPTCSVEALYLLLHPVQVPTRLSNHHTVCLCLLCLTYPVATHHPPNILWTKTSRWPWTIQIWTARVLPYMKSFAILFKHIGKLFGTKISNCCFLQQFEKIRRGTM